MKCYVLHALGILEHIGYRIFTNGFSMGRVFLRPVKD
jgi:hypothetical protein